MAKKKIELDFLLNDTAWKIENVSTSGAKIKPIRITEILIHSNNVRYEYAGDSSTGFFLKKSNKFVLQNVLQTAISAAERDEAVAVGKVAYYFNIT